MVRLFDNTLRDGGNVVGHGFPISLTQSIIGALLEAGIPDIECGNCKGLGAYAKADANVRCIIMLHEKERKATTVTGSIPGVTAPTITYKKGNETLTAAPADAGDYTASITLGEGENA